MAKDIASILGKKNLPESNQETIAPVAKPEAEQPKAKVAEPVFPESSRPITILSPLDSYIAERMKEQPADMEGVISRVETVERQTRNKHRLTLPSYFEERSHDNPEAKDGKWIFRWIFKEKRAIDRALNVFGWTLVNRTYFPEAPKYLFTANGGIEVGDAILGFMPAKKALELRRAPEKISQERLNSRMTKVSPDYVMMTDNTRSENVYQPNLGSEQTESADTVAVEGMPDTLIQRGGQKKDFD